MNYTKLTFKTKVKKPYLFIGSKIRGALGYALKDEVCINPSFICKECFASKDCIFYKMYELQNMIHNYRLDFKLYEDSYKFSIFLFNDLIDHTKTIKKAILTSMSEYAEIETKTKTKELKSKKESSLIKISFLTPLRMKKNNRYAIFEDDIELFDIVHSIYKRDLELQGKAYERLNISKDYKVITKKLNYKELTRKSNKQNRKMNMGGLMGEIVVSNVNKELYDLLKLGEIIGVGKSTVFGLGKIKIEDIK